ncbi:hypothetical protein AB6T38_15265 [Aliiglaciecola sp. SL4]
MAINNIPHWELISTTLPDVSITDADDALKGIRPVKSDIEIAHLRRA